MFATVIGNRVYVSLSRRNLRQLDAILNSEDVGNRCLVHRGKNGVSLVVHVEDDADHYAGHASGPGTLLPDVSRPESQSGELPLRGTESRLVRPPLPRRESLQGLI
jgi:hypothetical protein